MKLRLFRAVLVFVTAVSLLGLVRLQGALSTVKTDPPPAVVSIVKSWDGGSYLTDAQIEALVREAVALAGGLEQVISPGDVVCIKPNIVQTGRESGSGAVTHRAVTRTVVALALEAGAGEVYIAEGAAGFRNWEMMGWDERYATWKAYYDAGYDRNKDHYEDATGVPLYDLNDVGQTYPDFPGYSGPYDPAYVAKVTLEDGLLYRDYWLSHALLDADVVIDVPTLKNHQLAGVTVNFKNWVGVAPNDIYHLPGLPFYKGGLVHQYVEGYPDEQDRNARAFIDLMRCKPADFSVVDGLVGVMNGPVGGDGSLDTPSPPLHMILAGRDLLAVDVVATLAMGYDPDTVVSFGYAVQKGMGVYDPADITVIGESVQTVRYLWPDDFESNGTRRITDLTSPTLAGLSPASGSRVTGLVPVVPSGLGDNVGVVRAELYVDGELVSWTKVAPFEFAWDSTAVADGEHRLRYVAYDRVRNETSATARVTVGNTVSAGALVAGWNLVSVPVDPVDPAVTSVFSDAVAAGNALDNALYRYDGAYEVYPSQFTQVARGEGYWLKLTVPCSNSTVGVSEAGPVAVPLVLGWNLIGHPRPAATPLSLVAFTDGVSVLSFADAVAAGWISPPLYYYDGAYKTCTFGGDSESLEPWRGYWLKALASGISLVVP